MKLKLHGEGNVQHPLPTLGRRKSLTSVILASISRNEKNRTEHFEASRRAELTGIENSKIIENN